MGHYNSKTLKQITKPLTTYKLPNLDFDFLSNDATKFIEEFYDYNEEISKWEFNLEDFSEMTEREEVETLITLCLDTKQAFECIMHITTEKLPSKLTRLIKRFAKNFGINPNIQEILAETFVEKSITSLHQCRHKMKSKKRISLVHRLKRAIKISNRFGSDVERLPHVLWNELCDRPLNYIDYIYIMRHFVVDNADITNYLDELICECSYDTSFDEFQYRSFEESIYRLRRDTIALYDHSLLLNRCNLKTTIDESNTVVEDVSNLLETIGESDVSTEDVSCLPIITTTEKFITKENLKNVYKVPKPTKKTNLYKKIAKEVNRKRKHRPYWRSELDERQLFINDEIRMKLEIMMKVRKSPDQVNWTVETDFEKYTEEQIGEYLQLFSLITDKDFKNDIHAIGAESPRKLNTTIKRKHHLGELATLGEWEERLDSRLTITQHKLVPRDVYTLLCSYVNGLEKYGDPKEAFQFLQNKLIKWTEDGVAKPRKFALKFHPVSILFFIAQVLKRGFATNFNTNICLNRKDPLTSKDLFPDRLLEVLNKNLRIAPFKHPKMKTCLIQTCTKLDILQDECLRYRMCNYLSDTLRDQQMFLAYMYKYYYPKGVIPTSEEKPSTSKDDSDDSKEESPNPFDQNNPESRNFLAKKVAELWQGFTTKLEKATSSISSPIAEGLNTIYSQIIQILTKLEGFVDNCLGTITGFFDNLFGGPGGPVIRALDILELLFYYIIYKNVGTKIVKMFALSQMLMKMGVLKIVLAGLEWLFETTIDLENWFKKKKPEEETVAPEEDSKGSTPTSEDESSLMDRVMSWFENMTAEHLGKIVTILVVGFTSLLGYKISKSYDFSSAGEKVVKYARNWHFIGAGLFGIERVMKYAGSVFKVVGEFLRTIFSKKQAEEAKMTEEELEDLNKEVVRVDVMLMHYASHHGVEQIRTNIKKAEEAQEIVSKALRIYSESHMKPEIYTLEMKRMIQGFKKNMVDVLNVVQRVQNILKPRETPFHVQFYSEPGNGKSTLINHLVGQVQKEFYPDMGYNAVAYSRNSEDHFWPGYCGQPIVMVDEMYPILDAETLVKWMIYISNLPVMVPMAELSEKVTYFTSEWILSCTNVIYPSANGVASIEAVHRRRHLLVEVVIEEKVKDKTTGKFCKKLFDKYYPGQNSLDFPHLHFNLIKPVKDGADETAEYYMSGDLLPNGVREPTTNLTYQQLFETIKSRQACLKQEERNLRIYDKTMDMLNVENEWETIINYYNTNGLMVRDKDFFEINKPKSDITIDSLIDKEEERCEVIIEGELDAKNIKLSSEVENKDDLEISTFVLDVKIPIEDNKFAESRVQARLLCDEIEVKYLNEHKPSPVLVIAQLKLNSFTNTKISEWLDAHKSFTTKFKEDGFVLQHSEGVVPTSEDPDITRLEDILSRMPEEKTLLRERLERKLYHMKYGNTQPDNFSSVTTEFAEFKNNRHFGFEIFQNLDKEDVVQPNGEILSGKTAVDWNGKYLSLNFVNYTPRVHIYGKDFRPNEVPAKEMYRYENAFCLTRKESKDPLWERFNRPNTGILYLFLEHVEKIGDRYWFKWDDMILRIINHKRVKSKGERLPLCPTNIMCDVHMFNSLILFMELNEIQKDYILARVKSLKRSAYSYLKTQREYVAYVRKDLGEKLEALIPEKMKKIIKTLKRFLYVGGAVAGIIFAMRQIGSLFGGGTAGTSKTYFKNSDIVKTVVGTSEVFPQHEDHVNAIMKNMLKVCVIRDGTVNESNAIGIIGNVFVMCKHTLTWFLEDETIPYFDIEYRRSKRADVDFHKARIYRHQVCQVSDRDIVFIKSEHVSQFKNITKFFYTLENLQKRKPNETRVSLLYNTSGSGWNRIDFPKTKYHDSWKDRISGTNKTIQISGCYSYEFHAPLGSSGGLVLSQTNEKQCIMGVQCFTDGTYSYSSVITQNLIQRAVASLGTGITTEGPAFSENGSSPTEELITSNCVIEGTIKQELVLGTHLKSAYTKSPIAKHMPESRRIPAILNAFDPRVPNKCHPLQHSINKYGRDKMEFLDPEILNHAAEQVGIYYQNRVKVPIEFLTMEEIIKGIPKVDSMNVKTSPGIPWVYGRTLPGKKDYIRFSEEGEIEYLAEEVIHEFEKLEYNFLIGNIPPMSAYEFPKDELRPKEKVLQMKTRSIGVLPMELNMLYRKYNGGLDGAIRQLANGNNPICIGCNPDSLAWNEIYRNLKSKSNVGMDFDVGNWDGHLLHQLKQAANKVEDMLCENSKIDLDYYNRLFSKFSDKDFTFEETDVRSMITLLRETMSQSITHGYINFLDIVIQVMRGLRSGFGGTGDENCRAHFILLVYISNEIIHDKYGFLLDIDELFNYIVIYVYGDDVLIAIKEEFLTIVSYEEIIQKYEYYGWPITSAEKVGELKPRPIEDLQFLKRKFQPTTIKGMPIMVGALDKEVIHDLTYWLRKGKNPDGQFEENLDNALCFIWAHGKEETENFINTVNKALIKEGLPRLTKTWKVIDSQMKYRIMNGQDQPMDF